LDFSRSLPTKYDQDIQNRKDFLKKIEIPKSSPAPAPRAEAGVGAVVETGAGAGPG